MHYYLLKLWKFKVTDTEQFCPVVHILFITVPVKSKLTVSTRNSILEVFDSSKLEFRVSSFEIWASSFEFRASSFQLQSFESQVSRP